ncbi:MAG: hypothetical protein ACRD26_20705, partial [Vicinamibacterales bacterium]
SAPCALADGVALATTTTAASPTEREAARADNASGDTGAIANPAPVIGDATVDQPVLPPDGELHLVRVTYSLSDNCGPLRTRLFVRMNEPMKGEGDSTLSDDWAVVSEELVQLRGTHAGFAKEGRNYTITIISKDSAGNVSSEDVKVSVAPPP